MNMKLIRTIKLKLDIPIEVVKSTVDNFTKAFNYISNVGWEDSDANGISLHKKTYYTVREYLPSQLAISARMKAAESLKAVRAFRKQGKKVTCPQSNRSSIRYDARSYNIWFNRNEVSILTVNGRIKVPITVPEYFKQYVTWKRCSADLFIRNNKVFLNIVFSKDIEDTDFSNNVIGIDRGINNIAVTSENKFYSGNHIKKVSKRYELIRTKLQSCGSKSAKRHLQKISKKENRFRRDVNHKITKEIAEALNPGTIIALEDLSGIRQNKRRKKQRKEVNKWNFYQFEQFLSYKAEAVGCKIEHVDARYTSQKCSCCGYISRSNRKHQSIFKCRQCGFSLNADLNAARNISKNYLDAKCYPSSASVNKRNVGSDVSKDPLDNCTNA